MSAENKAPEAPRQGDIPIASTFFRKVDELVTRLFLLGYKKPLCKANDRKNINEVFKHAAELDLDCYTEDELTALLEVAAEAQSQAIAHTEYEDAKASRALGPVAFLTTLGSVLLFKGVDIADPGCQKFVAIVIASLFVFLVVIGTLMILWGIVPRFNLPKDQPPRIDRTFFADIAQSLPGNWVKSWEVVDAEDLKREEIRSRIVGAYRISGKVALKIAMLRRGMLWIFTSLILLLAGVVHFGIISYKGGKMLIAIDADNTLWDTNAIYENAQNGLIKRFCEAAKLPVPPDALQSLRTIDQSITKRHPDGLNYPTSLLLEGLRKSWANDRAIEDWLTKREAISMAYQIELQSPPVAFSSLRTALRDLRSQGKLILVTEGKRDWILPQLRRLGIESSFDSIEFVSKSPRKFLELLKHADGERAVMIGDQLDRDIEFAGAAGWQTIWIPGGFRPGHADLEERLRLPDVVVGDLSEAAEAIERLKKKPKEKSGQ